MPLQIHFLSQRAAREQAEQSRKPIVYPRVAQDNTVHDRIISDDLYWGNRPVSSSPNPTPNPQAGTWEDESPDDVLTRELPTGVLDSPGNMGSPKPHRSVFRMASNAKAHASNLGRRVLRLTPRLSTAFSPVPRDCPSPDSSSQSSVPSDPYETSDTSSQSTGPEAPPFAAASLSSGSEIMGGSSGSGSMIGSYASASSTASSPRTAAVLELLEWPDASNPADVNETRIVVGRYRRSELNDAMAEVFDLVMMRAEDMGNFEWTVVEQSHSDV